MPDPDDRHIVRARQHRTRLRDHHAVVPRPDRGGGHRRQAAFVAIELGKPPAARAHLAQATAWKAERQNASVMRRPDGDQSRDAVAAESPQVGSRNQPAHAVTDQHEL